MAPSASDCGDSCAPSSENSHATAANSASASRKALATAEAPGTATGPGRRTAATAVTALPEDRKAWAL